jgi:SAM-dependent methyltransferase
MHVISDLNELDAKLAECDAAIRISDDEVRRVFTTFRMDFSAKVPADPFCPEYRDAQMSLYKRISGRNYDPRNEVTEFDVQAADRRPFPYYTGSCRTVGYFTMGVGYLLHVMNLPPGARVVEFGAGWGNTTIAMAMVGMDVTAVDIENRFCELLRYRAARHEVNVTTVNADFMWAETIRDPFDAAVFFESFHHCWDHVRLLKALHTAVKPGGRVYLAAEPIVADFPLPWGLRMDGESLWAIRSNGWMELGYSERYFRDALALTGWTAVRHVLQDLGWAAVWEMKRVEETATHASDSQHPATTEEQHTMSSRPEMTPTEARLRKELDSVYRSTSWRVTAPLRTIKQYLRA